MAWWQPAMLKVHFLLIPCPPYILLASSPRSRSGSRYPGSIRILVWYFNAKPIRYSGLGLDLIIMANPGWISRFQPELDPLIALLWPTLKKRSGSSGGEDSLFNKKKKQRVKVPSFMLVPTLRSCSAEPLMLIISKSSSLPFHWDWLRWPHLTSAKLQA